MIAVMAVAVALPFGAAVAGMLLGRRLPPRFAPAVTKASTAGTETGGPHASPRDAADGSPRDAADGSPRDAADGSPRDAADGSPHGFPHGAGPGRTPWSGAAIVSVGAAAVATLIVAAVAVAQWRHPVPLEDRLATVPTGSTPIEISLYLDGLSATVALLVCCVALAVHIYSVAYMADDARYPSYAAFVSLFTSAMLLVVLAGDLLVLYVGWEVMGVCSYFLIGHYWHDRSTSRAAVKAFLVTRVGDVGFLFGVFVLGIGAGTFSIRELVADAGELPAGVVFTGTLLLLAGVAGKSAQFPLHTWLPDAMAGPTPISALIHAATMVAAGIFVVARLFPVFEAAPVTLAVLGLMASISMLGAALAALVQDDLKRVLAYSTISQLAYMAAGLAAGTADGAIFHLLTHGAFKALLFLGAGCVITVVGSNLLPAMGGLRPAPGRAGMPITFWAMTVGWASLVGLPPASGFFSKDVIVEAAGHAVAGLSGAAGAESAAESAGGAAGSLIALSAWLVYLSALATIVVTAAYATRAWLMTFFGERRSAFEPREAPALMSRPVAVLAVPALLLGLAGLGVDGLRPAPGTAVLSLLLAAAGAGGAFLVWNADPARDPARVLGPVRPVLDRGFFVDEVYAWAVVRPVRALARLVVVVDAKVVDAAVEGTGRATRGVGGLLRVPHNGNPQAYVTGMLAGVVIVVMAVVVVLT